MVCFPPGRMHPQSTKRAVRLKTLALRPSLTPTPAAMKLMKSNVEIFIYGANCVVKGGRGLDKGRGQDRS